MRYARDMRTVLTKPAPAFWWELPKSPSGAGFEEAWDRVVSRLIEEDAQTRRSHAKASKEEADKSLRST